MNSLELFCPDIGSHDHVNQFRSKAISSFYTFRPTPHHFFSANLEDKFKLTQVLTDTAYLARCLNPSLWTGVSQRTIGRGNVNPNLATHCYFTSMHAIGLSCTVWENCSAQLLQRERERLFSYRTYQWAWLRLK